MVFPLTGGERHEQPVLPLLMEHGAVKRPGRGRPRVRPDRVAADKGYSSPVVRRYLAGQRIGSVIPPKANEIPDPAFERDAYRERNAVERLINRLKQWQCITRRYEERRQLPNHDHGRAHPALVMKARHAPVSLAISVI